ncbi:MAG: hypothetical protein ACLTMH_11960 [Faecalimonas umbilicata]|uniref:hypothetical protein n=1 Tax=Faecalimonas umbilicata TaxID=1912855 RepID=UPI003992BEA2
MNYNRMGVPHKKVSGTLFKGILSRSTLDKCGQATKSGRSFQNAFVTAGERKMEMEI